MSFLWHDYETFGTNAAFDRPCQFAAIRTNDALEEIGAPMTWFAQPARDSLPHPMACLVTGITPQRAEAEGVPEAEFAGLIHEEMMQPGTCSAGYNSLRFDDHVSRHLFYRNFIDPYEREWRDGNSRWDLIDLVRMCYALRPEGLIWPEREPGIPSFRLEHLTAANDIEHAGAHDALVDVRATIELARRVQQAQPELFAWGLRMRKKAEVNRLLDPTDPRPLVFSGSGIPAARGATTLVLPLAVAPDRKNDIIVADLSGHTEPLLHERAEDLAKRTFIASADLPEGVERVPLKTIGINKVPMLAPLGTLKGVDLDRIGLDREACLAKAAELLNHQDAVRARVMEVYLRPPSELSGDPDDMLYGGPFFSRNDKAAMERLRGMAPDSLADHEEQFEDRRIPEMVFRYRARNWPASLAPAEAAIWETDRLKRLRQPGPPGRLDLETFREELEEARELRQDQARDQELLDQVEAWVDALVQRSAS